MHAIDRVLQRYGREVLENLPVMLDVQDLEHRVQWANRAYREAVGLDLDGIRGRRCFEVRGLVLPCEGCPAEESLRTGRMCETELLPANQPAWPFPQSGLLVRAEPLRDDDGRVVGVIEVIGDISDYVDHVHRQEEIGAALLRLFDFSADHSSRETLRAILDEAEALTGSTVGFYHFVEEDQETLSLQMWSTNTERTCTAPGAGTHYPIGKAGVWVDCVRQGRPVIHNDYASLPHRRGLPEGHAPVIRELVLPVSRKGRLVAILGVGNKPTDYDDGDVACVGQLAELAWEAVSRKQAEERHHELQVKYEHAQKMESIGRLAGGVAHDFNNMLSVILGQVELAMEGVTPGGEVHQCLAEVRRAAQRSADLTRQLLGFARQQPMEQRIMDLNAAVADTQRMIRRLIGEDIRMEWAPSPRPAVVSADPTQIDQVLANLCVNARDAIADAGTIRIAVGERCVDEAEAAANPRLQPGDYVVLEVADDGCGLEPAVLDSIFEPFFTTKARGQGTGLGLSMVYGIVRQNGGCIDVESAPGEGTAFRILLPRHDEAVAAVAVAAEAVRTSEPGAGQLVLLVEDEPMILRFESQLLERLGYRVLPAMTPRAALELANRHRDEIDLLVSDVIMPDLNGPELATRIAAIIPRLPTLFVSGYTTSRHLNEGLLDDGVAFLRKPFTAEDLAAKLEELLAATRIPTT